MVLYFSSFGACSSSATDPTTWDCRKLQSCVTTLDSITSFYFCASAKNGKLFVMFTCTCKWQEMVSNKTHSEEIVAHVIDRDFKSTIAIWMYIKCKSLKKVHEKSQVGKIIDSHKMMLIRKSRRARKIIALVRDWMLVHDLYMNVWNNFNKILIEH